MMIFRFKLRRFFIEQIKDVFKINYIKILRIKKYIKMVGNIK